MAERNKNPLEIFFEEAPSEAQAFNGLIQAVSDGHGLDDATRQLLYIAMRASQGDTGAVVAHARMAKEAGVSREALRDAIVMTLMVCGIRGVLTCLGPALSAWEAA